VPQVRGRVIEVPVEGNRPVKKGDVLFRIDPTPYENEVKAMQAKLAFDEATLVQSQASVVDARAGSRELRENLKAQAAKLVGIRSKIDLARMRVTQNRELSESGAGDVFTLQQAQSSVRELEAELTSAQAAEAQVRERLSALVGGDLASVAGAKARELSLEGQIEATRAQLANAQWELAQTTVYAPVSGTVINLQLRVGSYVTPLALTPVMSFVEDSNQVIAFYQQNELHQVAPGNEAELALKTLPGRILKAKVESVVWAQGQGQLLTSGALPQTGVQAVPPGRFAVKLDLADKHRDIFLAAGAGGEAAIYTDSLGALHVVRKVILRVGAYLNYVVPKLH
jgi:multidrug resistance efflux pump